MLISREGGSTEILALARSHRYIPVAVARCWYGAPRDPSHRLASLSIIALAPEAGSGRS
jgi:hypothetical protein